MLPPQFRDFFYRWSLAEGKLRPLAEGGRRPRALHFGGRMSEIWIQCFSCCITDEPPPKRRHRIDRSMIGSPTNFRHTAHVGSGDMNVHDSPARRADFTRIIGCSIFPKKVCAVWWLENSDCIARAIEIVEPVTKYLLQLKHTDSQLKASLKTSMKDPFIKCKLALVRRAYNGIKSLGGVENVSITKRMLLAVRDAKHPYRAGLVRKKEYLDKKASKTQEKRKLENELQQLYNQKRKIRLEKEKKETEFEEKIQILEEKKKSLL
ncbi:hypothetical protein AVEN_109215-1 [Araneus ventricosus]|uniref:CRIB domain-containing protein n=1 Tax=Araneus ventricosus TaxID=182803 RepID=A0A4Y2P2F6_ARAVE|nr:hypothetical protein AVEN_109215-1 [Araneus ventricosus]